MTELTHHGILGMHWGIRRYQNPDGSLTAEGQKRRAERDQKWVKKNYDKIYNNAYKKFSNELKRNNITEITAKNEKKIPRSYLNAYNKEMAKIMNVAVGDLADADYNVEQAFKNGIWKEGRVAYRKNSVDRMHI